MLNISFIVSINFEQPTEHYVAENSGLVHRSIVLQSDYLGNNSITVEGTMYQGSATGDYDIII